MTSLSIKPSPFLLQISMYGWHSAIREASINQWQTSRDFSLPSNLHCQKFISEYSPSILSNAQNAWGLQAGAAWAQSRPSCGAGVRGGGDSDNIGLNRMLLDIGLCPEPRTWVVAIVGNHDQEMLLLHSALQWVGAWCKQWGSSFAEHKDQRKAHGANVHVKKVRHGGEGTAWSISGVVQLQLPMA